MSAGNLSGQGEKTALSASQPLTVAHDSPAKADHSAVRLEVRFRAIQGAIRCRNLNCCRQSRAMRIHVMTERRRSHSQNVVARIRPICKITGRFGLGVGKIALALKSGADAPANLLTRARWTPLKGAMRPTRQLNGKCRYASRSRLEQLEYDIMFAIKQSPSATPTPEQSVRLHALANAERRPHWVRADAWEDLKAN